MVFTEFTSFPGGQHILLCSTQSSTRPSGDSSTSRYSVHLAPEAWGPRPVCFSNHADRLKSTSLGLSKSGVYQVYLKMANIILENHEQTLDLGGTCFWIMGTIKSTAINVLRKSGWEKRWAVRRALEIWEAASTSPGNIELKRSKSGDIAAKFNSNECLECRAMAPASHHPASCLHPGSGHSSLMEFDQNKWLLGLQRLQFFCAWNQLLHWLDLQLLKLLLLPWSLEWNTADIKTNRHDRSSNHDRYIYVDAHVLCMCINVYIYIYTYVYIYMYIYT